MDVFCWTSLSEGSSLSECNLDDNHICYTFVIANKTSHPVSDFAGLFEIPALQSRTYELSFEKPDDVVCDPTEPRAVHRILLKHIHGDYYVKHENEANEVPLIRFDDGRCAFFKFGETRGPQATINFKIIPVTENHVQAIYEIQEESYDRAVACE